MATRSRKAGKGQAPTLLTVKLADAVRRKREAISEFPLDSTVPGSFARVRWVTLNDTASVMALPPSMQTAIIDQVNETAAQIQGAGTMETGRALYQATDVVYQCYCVAGFVEPALIGMESDRTNPDQVLVTDIHAADRARFFEWCKANDPNAQPERVAS